MVGNIKIIDFGLSPYREIWKLQQKLNSELVNDVKSATRGIEISDIRDQYILIGEHLPVYTLGFHGNENNLLVNADYLQNNGAECIRIERGGDITFHGPGQLVVYPILYLKNYHLSIKDYIHLLETSVIELLTLYNITAETVDGAVGVWIDADISMARKICAIGVKATRFCTMHGLALNVNTDLSAFKLINPCGFKDKGVTSIFKETNNIVDMNEIKKEFLSIFTSNLQIRF